MKKNILLSTAIIVCKTIQITVLLIIATLTVFFIHLQINKDYYKGKELQSSTKNYNYSVLSKWKVDQSMEDREVFTLDNIKTVSLYVNYFKYVAILLFVFMAIREFKKIINSVKKVETFGEKNVKSFRRIGIYILLYSLLMSFWSIKFNLGGFKGYGFSVSPFILAIASFILAEIFKEGNQLQQENNLTI